MKWIYKLVRAIILVLLVLIFLVPSGLYIALSMSGVQTAIRDRAERELTKLLGVEVTINDVSITPFNRVKLYGVNVNDAYGNHALEVKKLGAGMSLWSYITRGQVELSYAEIIGMKARIYKLSPDSQFNIQPIIDALASKDPDKPESMFDFRINTVVIRGGEVSYDVMSEPEQTGRFSADHVHLAAFNADIQLPVIRNDEFNVKIRRLSFMERVSGFELQEFSGLFNLSDTVATVSDLKLRLPNSLVAFRDMRFEYDSLKTLAKDFVAIPVSVALLPQSHITPADLRAFEPALAPFDRPLDLSAGVEGTLDKSVNVSVALKRSGELSMRLKGVVNDAVHIADMTFSFNDFTLDISGSFPEHYPSLQINEKLRRILNNSESIKLVAKASGAVSDFTVNTTVDMVSAQVAADARFRKEKGGYTINGSADVKDADLQSLFAGVVSRENLPSMIYATVDYAVHAAGKDISGNADVKISDVTYRENKFRDISFAVKKHRENYVVDFQSKNPMLDCEFSADAVYGAAEKRLNFSADIADVDLSRLVSGVPFNDLSGIADIKLNGKDMDHLQGYVNLQGLKMTKIDGQELRLDTLALTCTRDDDNVLIKLNSDIADGELQGVCHLSTFLPMCRTLVANVMPVLERPDMVKDVKLFDEPHKDNDVIIGLRIKDSSPLEAFAKLPVRVIYPVDISACINSGRKHMDFTLTAPYLQQGNKLIEETKIIASLNGMSDSLDSATAQLSFSSLVPTKKGMMNIVDRMSVIENTVNNNFSFKIDCERQFSGSLKMMALLSRNDAGSIVTDVNVGRSNMVFNDTSWTVNPSHISLVDKILTVDDFKADREGQSILIVGKSTALPDDSITVTLDNVNLDYVFETLNIPNVTFGGNATGKLFAKQVLTTEPIAYTPKLDVQRLKYNYSLLGDGIIKSRWNTPEKAVELNVTINQDNGRTTYVDGRIKPIADSLDLRFNADKVPVGFLHPVMSAFATEVSGEATGDIHLWGTFSLVQLVGNVYGENMKLKLGVNNAAYYFSDSIKFTPGLISFNDITIKDEFGHTALVNGRVTHKYLKDAGFDFNISKARDIMVYDMKEGADRTWFGRVFANGDVNVKGEPGLVSVNVDMSTAPGSQFNLVMSNALSARNYDFITFRDRDREQKELIASQTAPPPIVTELKNKMNAVDKGKGSVYEMNFALEVTPQAQITLVMDPVAGDRIRAYGNGNMLLDYNSRDDVLNLKGTYTIERGTYNFTLQDIIIKEFTLEEGSKISFTGDVNAAQLDIKAAYTLNANLTDLDESFAADKELNRTNVPISAILLVSGDIHSPEIGYDLAFPTLSYDMEQKVRSIVNTDEMMNRQIIYLLALNRFYTPDYMNTSNRSSELMSVASSTISSQLSSMLGQLSENWNISPNFRSDRGDFSDVEVNLALSSHLLNNRLLLNGNFGYRDKSLNNNSFIGDFDIEYLLNRRGSLRLKAYNRYNDQNYYVKSALTTQGVGIVFKHDFDNFFRWIFPRKSK